MAPRAAKLSPVENPLSICDLSLKKVLKLIRACQESLEKTCSKGENVTFSQCAVAAAYAPETVIELLSGIGVFWLVKYLGQTLQG